MKPILRNEERLASCVSKGFLDYLCEVDIGIFCVRNTKLQVELVL